MCSEWHFQWEAHILRSIYQDQAKQDLKQKDPNTALLVMDWAMKFLQLKHREKQSDWFGKLGLSRLISQQLLNRVSARDIGKGIGVDVTGYDFSEPQYGKDICDGILSPIKSWFVDIAMKDMMFWVHMTCVQLWCKGQFLVLLRVWVLSMRASKRWNSSNYLTKRFDISERTGSKADPAQAAADVRTARTPNGFRLFSWSHRLKNSQVEGFFSRLASTKRKKANTEEERLRLLDSLASELAPKHSISFDTYCLCDCLQNGQLQKFSVPMLNEMLRHFNVSLFTRDRKKELLTKLSTFLESCEC